MPQCCIPRERGAVLALRKLPFRTGRLVRGLLRVLAKGAVHGTGFPVSGEAIHG